jgi:hypothetical protein
MVEVICLSDDEAESENVAGSARSPGKLLDSLDFLDADQPDLKRPYRLVLVDSRQCPLMPRPRFLPIAFANDASSAAVQEQQNRPSGNAGHENTRTFAEEVRSTAEVDDDEEDPDYEDLRPLKRRKTGLKRVPKKHGKLTAPDWEVVTNGDAGPRRPLQQSILPARNVSNRKEARDYVKRLTANVDWEDILRHVEMLRPAEAKPIPDVKLQETTGVKPRRGPSQANRLKQYWQGVMVKSVLKMDADCSK